jgi:hypothetical protein
MGTSKLGVLSAFKGRIGPVVGSTYRGKQVIKGRPEPSNRPPSAAQLAQRQRFGLVMGFMRRARPIVDAGFLVGNPNSAPINEAVRFNLMYGLSGTYPDITLNYPEIRLTTGQVGPARSPVAIVTAEGALEVSWDATPGREAAFDNDQALVMLFNETQDEVLFLEETVLRSDGSCSIPLPADYNGQSVHVWIGFVREDGSDASYSRYVGNITIG